MASNREPVLPGLLDWGEVGLGGRRAPCILGIHGLQRQATSAPS